MASKRGLDRIVNFGDAVVAIAITLLVLPLVDLHTSEPAIGVVDLVRHHGFEFLAFFLSFVVIGRLWMVHHRLFEVVDAYDHSLVRINMLWLLTIAFLPFPTQMLATSSNDRGASGLYIGTLMVSSLCLESMRWHLEHTPALREPTTGVDQELPWLTSALFAAAFVAALAIPGVGTWALLALLLETPIAMLVRSRRRSAVSRTTPPAGAPGPEG